MTYQPLVIGLTGPAGVGKSTYANKLAREFHQLGYPVATLAFADALREEVQNRYGLPDHQMERGYDKNRPIEPADEEYTFYAVDDVFGFEGTLEPIPSVRQVLQWYGANKRNNECPTYWCQRWWHRLQVLTRSLSWVDKPVVVIADDVRYRNECEAVREKGFVVELRRLGLRTNTPDHESENQSLVDLVDRFVSLDDSAALAVGEAEWYLSRYNVRRTQQAIQEQPCPGARAP